MQMVAAIMCEFLNMMYLTGQKQTIKSITGFTTIKTLTELDNIYLSAVSDPTFSKLKSDKEFPPVNVYPKVRWSDRSFSNKVMYTGNKLMRLVYQSFYFYFLPFVCIIANFAAPRCDLVMRLSTTETVERNNF
jgi:hypothetical protein